MNIKFSTEKSKVMVINDRGGEVNRRWQMGEEELEVVEEYKYLGITLGNKGLEKEKNGWRLKAEKQYNMINAGMKLRSNKYEIMRGLWKGVAVPTVMYGAELIDADARDIQGLEVVQNRAARSGLGANKYAPSETLGGEMGWSSFGERVDKTKMKYLLRLDYMREDRWPKKVKNWTGANSRTIRDYKRRMRKADPDTMEGRKREEHTGGKRRDLEIRKTNESTSRKDGEGEGTGEVEERDRE